VKALRSDTRHMAYCDIHSEANVDFGEILRWQRAFEPHVIVLNGDVTLAEYASHWNEKSAFKHLGYNTIGARLDQEFRATHRLLARIRAASPRARIVWVPGNHEAWYYWVALYHPQTGVVLGQAPDTLRFRTDLKAAADSLVAGIIRRHFKTDLLDIEVAPFNEAVHIGPLTYLHGHQFRSVTATVKAYPSNNVVIGHFHRKRITVLPDSGRRGRPIQHFAVPTLMKLGRGYETLKSSDHSNGFFYASASRSGLFEGYIKDVFGDEGRLFPWKV
jgi:predicted phosphodiesterase